uniref:Truncated envelope glycoprotein n=1 Tax=Heterorhabditis bacteriophora TaxID=37862 RepID=A0A1I7X8M7_HETBA
MNENESSSLVQQRGLWQWEMKGKEA